MAGYLCHILVMVAIFATLGVSYNIIMGCTGIISLAHAVFFAVGGYTAALLMQHLGALPFILVVLGGIITAGILAAAFMLLVGRVRGEYLVIVTLGFQLVFINLLINLKGLTGGTLGLRGIPRPELFGFQFNSELSYAALAGISCGVAIGVSWWISRSPFGRSLKALRDDEVGAQSMGKNIFRLKLMAFGTSGAIAGIAGALYAPYYQFINPFDFTLFESIIIMVIVIVGGTGNLWGSVLGAVVLVSIPEVLRFIPITSGFTAQLREVVFGFALLLVVWLRPQGFLGEYAFGAVKNEKGEEGLEPPKLTESQYQELVFLVKHKEGKAMGSNREERVLKLSGLSKDFGGIRAVDNLSLNISPEKKVVGIIGPNGAGKTTLFDLVCGYTKPDSGVVKWKRQDITNKRPHEVARSGIGRSFQDLRLFQRMTVLDNVTIGLQPFREDESVFHIFSPRIFAHNKEYKEKAAHYLEGVGLADKRNKLAEDLAYPERKLLALARLLSSRSELLLLDELAAGLDPESMQALARLVRRLAENGIMICLVEHSLDFVQHAVDTILFLDQGRLIAEGPTEEIMRDKRLSRLYFGAPE